MFKKFFILLSINKSLTSTQTQAIFPASRHATPVKAIFMVTNIQKLFVITWENKRISVYLQEI